MLKQRLSKPSLLVDRAYVNGEWISADNGEKIAVVDPATGQKIASVPALGAAETRRAIQGAERAWAAWREKPAAERASLLDKRLHGRLVRAHRVGTTPGA